MTSVPSSIDSAPAVGLIEPGLVVINLPVATKAEALQLAVRRLHLRGRTMDPFAVECALWERERSGSTALGGGYAIPHCRTDAMVTNSLVLLKTRAPVDWEAFDHQPVRTMALLALRATDPPGEHLKILARFSRQLMQADFRARLEAEQDPAALCGLLARELCPGEVRPTTSWQTNLQT